MKTTRLFDSPRLLRPAPGSARHTLIALKRTVSRQLTRQYGPRLPAALVRRAVSDAEELAQETGFPNLFFPALAEEKVRTVSDFLSPGTKRPPVKRPQPSS